MDNPNIMAIIICLSIPACFHIFSRRKKRILYLSLYSALTIFALIILECRTAFIGLLFISIIVAGKVIGLNIIPRFRYKLFFVIPVFLIFCAFLFSLHLKKQNSSDSRLTIWSIASNMISAKPVFGYGYGQFQKEYNLQQAEYFNTETHTEQERINAGFTTTCYNEYIQHAIMGGIIGCSLLLALMVSLIHVGWKNRNKQYIPLAGIVAFAVMSFFNFTIESPPIFFMFVIYASILIGNTADPSRPIYNSLHKKIIVAGLFIAFAFIVTSLQKYNAQKELAYINDLIFKKELEKADYPLHSIEPKISTSEAFYRIKARHYILKQDYINALKAIETSLKYTSAPSVLLEKAQLDEKTGNLAAAESCYKLVCGIEPHLFKPRVMLMEMYLRNNNIENARIIAHEITSMNPKVNSEKVTKYKEFASEIVKLSSTN
ncbi:O-antigen ligase family protein [Dysgonomonas sp. 216]|uniref:O-antigen ligase family protein n=1 Tax=Dysgonomonas sp. 216 TaxID=2302934 RepID=UPI0013D6DE82|nr:O-antigen ligase family protein [Dysgonomonas sp. 216]